MDKISLPSASVSGEGESGRALRSACLRCLFPPWQGPSWLQEVWGIPVATGFLGHGHPSHQLCFISVSINIVLALSDHDSSVSNEPSPDGGLMRGSWGLCIGASGPGLAGRSPHDSGLPVSAPCCGLSPQGLLPAPWLICRQSSSGCAKSPEDTPRGSPCLPSGTQHP